MADQTANYEALFHQAEEARRQAEEARQQAEEARQQAEEARQQAEEARQHEAERRWKAEEAQRQAEELNRPTDLEQYIRNCHLLLSIPFQVGHPASSTKGKIPAPSGKLCPTRLCKWTDFEAEQRQIYAIVLRHLGGQGRFSSVPALEDLGRRLSQRRISSEKDLESWSRRAVEEHVEDIVRALGEVPAARDELNLGDGIRFDNHSNNLDDDDDGDQDQESRVQPLGQADQYCIHRKEGQTNALLTTVEYKPPHKLSIETLCAGLRPMEFWQDIVDVETVPTDETEKLAYNAALLAGAAVVQEYHVMIQEGLAYSYLSTGQAFVFLHVPETEPSTLYYHLCVPNKDVEACGLDSSTEPLTAVSRVLCLCLMSCGKETRGNAWRNAAIEGLHTWATSFDYTRDQIPEKESGKTPPGSEYVPSSPLSSPDAARRRNRPQTRSMDAPEANPDLTESSDSDSPSTSTSRPGLGHKRNHSAIASSPPQPRRPPGRGNAPLERGQQRRPTNKFCTLKCLSELKSKGELDNNCPNVMEHRQGQDVTRHLINAPMMVRLLEEQLGKDPDHLCIPYGERGGFAAPFKITLASYGYTVIGKGTTSKRWEEVSRELPVYQHLSSVQGSVIPVFLGSLDLAQTYFLHGAGAIRHFLLMAWGGEMLTQQDMSDRSKEVARCRAELRRRGVRHDDWRPPNLLWNNEVGRVLAIDFHKANILITHPRVGELKRKTISGSKDRPDNGPKRQQRQYGLLSPAKARWYTPPNKTGAETLLLCGIIAVNNFEVEQRLLS